MEVADTSHQGPDVLATASSVYDAATPRRHSGMQVLSPSFIDPALENHGQHTASGRSSGLDHLALLASQQKWDNGTMDSVMRDTTHTSLPEMSAAPSWTLGMSTAAQTHTMGSFDPRMVQTHPGFQNVAPSPNTTSRYNLGDDLYGGRSDSIQENVSTNMGINSDITHMPQDLQTWFDQFDLDPNLEPGNLQDFGNPGNQVSAARRGSSLSASDAPTSLRNPSSPSALIPNERFAKVEKCWPIRKSNPLRLMPTLWWDAAMKAEDNLFSKGTLSPEAIEQNRQCGSRWGLDEDCRERLQSMFVTLTSTASLQTTNAAFTSPENFSSPSESRTGQAPSVTTETPTPSTFPPAEIFDIGLDLYFRQFHPLMPFIHTPTFCPKTAPTSLLFIMCLIGLTILQTKGATTFVRQTFSVSITWLLRRSVQKC